MKSVKICYTKRDNMGDSINPLIIRNVFGMMPINSNVYNCRMSGIGSGLHRFLVNTEGCSLENKLKIGVHRFINYKPVTLWSAGFINTPTGNELPIRKKIRVASVRGNMSKKWVEKILKCNLDCTVGDAGLLASELIPKQEKQFVLGIIPHDNERGEFIYQQIQQTISPTIIIDVRGDVIQRLQQISQCDCIISSSLHGLVFADSFHIPNRQVVLTDKLAGDGFKFYDYYSSFGLTPNPIDIKTEKIDINAIKKDYPIRLDSIEKLKSDIKEAFYRFL